MDQPISFKDTRLLIRQDIAPGLFLGKIQEVTVEVALEGAKIVGYVLIEQRRTRPWHVRSGYAFPVDTSPSL